MRSAMKLPIVLFLAASVCGCRSTTPAETIVAPAPAAVAEDLKLRIETAAESDRWNDALLLLGELDRSCRDPASRASAGVDELSARIVAGRETYFGKQAALTMYRATYALIEAKVRERETTDPAGGDAVDAPSDAARRGTIAAARGWAIRELPAELGRTVSADLGLAPDDLDRFWKSRRVSVPRQAVYGSGSFIVVGTRNPSDLTDEQWWHAADPVERMSWLTAFFVESSGLFEIVKTDGTPCGTCHGSGSVGASVRPRGPCPVCHGACDFRSVTYR